MCDDVASPDPPQAPLSSSRALPAGAGPRLSLLLALGILGVALHRFAATALPLLRSPFSRDYGEGCTLGLLQLLAERGNYFTDLSQYPMVHGIYPPAFVLLNLPFYYWLGPTLAVPRALSLAFAIGIAAVVFLLLHGRSRNPVFSGSFALLALAPWYVHAWAGLARVDTMAVFFSLLALLLWDRSAGRPGPLRRGALVAFWVAAFTKQNALLAPAAAILSLLLVPDRRREGLTAAATYGLPLAGLFGILFLATNGEAWRHLVPYTAAAKYEWSRMAKSYRDFVVGVGPLLAIAVPAVATAPRRLLTGRDGVFVLYFLLNLAGLATIAKEGAAQNYFIEPMAATVVLAALVLLAGAATRPGLWRAWPSVFLVAATVATFTDYERGRHRQAVVRPSEVAEFRLIDQNVRLADGPVLSENLSFLVLNRIPVLAEPFGLLLTSRAGLLEPQRLLDDCRARRFALIVSEFRLQQLPDMGTCMSAGYERWKRLGPYELLRPRGVGGR